MVAKRNGGKNGMTRFDIRCDRSTRFEHHGSSCEYDFANNMMETVGALLDQLAERLR
jgi:hypothetical protein